MYQGQMPLQIQGSSEAYLNRAMLLASKKAVTKKWLCWKPHLSMDWSNVIHNIFVMRNMTYFDIEE